MTKAKLIKIVVTIAIAILAIVNTMLAGMGKSPLPISDDTVNLVLSGAISTVFLLYNTWKNRNITTAAQKGQELTDILKSGQATVYEVTNMLDTLKKRQVK